MYSEAGKGSAPRKNQDQDSYRDNWERIFGKKNCEEPDNDELDPVEKPEFVQKR